VYDPSQQHFRSRIERRVEKASITIAKVYLIDGKH
jgi:hypothetical protein